MRIALILCVLSAVTSGQTTRSGDDLDSLIANLSSDVWKTRQEAQDKLVAMGEEVRPQLERALHDAQPGEARRMLEGALRAIEEQYRLGATLITLHLSDVVPSDAFAELAKQSGVELRTMPENLWALVPWNRLSIDITRKPFWLAASELCEKAGVTLQPWGSDLRIMQGQGLRITNGPYTLSGPFLIKAQNAVRTHAIDYAGGAESGLQITFQAIAEPKIRVQRTSFATKLDVAVDEKGNSLIPEQTPNSSAAAIHAAGGLWTFRARLTDTPTVGDRIALLRGSISVTVVTRSDTLEVNDVLHSEGTARQIGGMNIGIGSIKTRAQSEVELRLSIKPDSQRLDWSSLEQSLAGIVLFDANGRRYVRRDMSSGGNESGIEVGLVFAPDPTAVNNNTPGAPTKLVWSVPAELRELEIPFEFKDLPIPK